MNFKWGMFASVAAILISVILGIFSGVNALHIFLRALIFGVIFFGIGFGLRFVINSFFPELLFSGKTEQEGEPGSKIDITLDSTGEYAVPELYKTSGDSEELGNIEDLIAGVFRPRSDDENGNIMQPRTYAGIDRKSDTGYNDKGMFDVSDVKDDGFGVPADWGDVEGISSSSAASGASLENRQSSRQTAYEPQFTTNFGDESGLDSLPDLDSMARAFSGFEGEAPGAGAASASTAFMPTPVQAAPAEEFIPGNFTQSGSQDAPDRSQYTGNKPQVMQGDFDPKDMAKGISTILSKDK